MSVAAVLGAGEIGGAVAHTLAIRAGFLEIRLVDAAAGVAQGKALDIQQSGPLLHFDTRISGSTDVLSVTGADVVILADTANEGEWEGERGLALIGQLIRAGAGGAFVCATPKQTWLMEAGVRELGLGADRVVGTAASAIACAARALVAAEINGSPQDVAVTVVGRPPGFVVAWSSATIAGSSIADYVAPHRLLAISQQLRALWPPKPQAIAAITAEISAGLAHGSRRHLPAMTVLDGEFGMRRVAAMLPVELGNKRVIRRLEPTLSPQERVEFLNGLEKAIG
jgi:malate dehydrogenase